MKTTRAELASFANHAARDSRRGGAPVLTGGSAREEVLRWLLWNDPNGIYTDERNRHEDMDPLTEEEAWEELADVLSDDYPTNRRGVSHSSAAESTEATFSTYEFPTVDSADTFSSFIKAPSRRDHRVVEVQGELDESDKAEAKRLGGYRASEAAKEDCSHAHPPEVPTTPCESSPSTSSPALDHAGRKPEEMPTGVRIDSACDVYLYHYEDFSKRTQEVFVVGCLSVSGELIGKPYEVALGQRAEVGVECVDVVRPVIQTNASGFYALHFHPSGHAKPSKADIELTQMIAEHTKSNLPGVGFVDHVVIGCFADGGGEYCSIHETKQIYDGKTHEVIGTVRGYAKGYSRGGPSQKAAQASAKAKAKSPRKSPKK